MQIKKAKLSDPGLILTFTERKEDGTVKKVTEEHETKPHPDLITSFDALRIHLALLTGYLTFKQVKHIESPSEDLVESFHVRGVSIKTGDDEGVVISGHKILENGKAVILNTPFTRFQEAEESAYKFIDDLGSKIVRANKEISAYLDGSKKADDPQGSLPFEMVTDDGTDKVKPYNQELREGSEANTGDPELWEGGERPQLGAAKTV